MISPFYLANRMGIPRLEDVGVTVTSTNVIYNFRNHPLFQTPFNGLIIFKLSAIPSGTTSTLPITFESTSRQQELTKIGGVAATVGDITGEGIYLAFYESNTSTLQLL